MKYYVESTYLDWLLLITTMALSVVVDECLTVPLNEPFVI